MSYVVSITRPEGPPIEPAEVAGAVAGETGFAQPGNIAEHAPLLIWQSSTQINLSQGSLWVATPSDAALRMMQTLAVRLDARVLGEEGEDLTEVDLAIGKAGCAAPALLLLGGVALLGVEGTSLMRQLVA
jgi:hypothetical protein